VEETIYDEWMGELFWEKMRRGDGVTGLLWPLGVRTSRETRKEQMEMYCEVY